MVRCFIVCACLFLMHLPATVLAGWYECYNFKGTIDQYPVTLSVQIREGYFGEKDKKDFNAIGVYKYDKHNQPIRLEGKLDKQSGKVLLYELTSEKRTAAVEFSFSEKECTGNWKSLATNKTMALRLSFVSKLVDTAEQNETPYADILQSASLPEYYFVGEYSKKAGEESAQMNRLHIIRKKDSALFQTIDFATIETATGNVMTIVFDNVEVVDRSKKQLTVSNNCGRMGGYLNIYFNTKTGKFRLDPKPVIEGPN